MGHMDIMSSYYFIEHLLAYTLLLNKVIKKCYRKVLATVNSKIPRPRVNKPDRGDPVQVNFGETAFCFKRGGALPRLSETDFVQGVFGTLN